MSTMNHLAALKSKHTELERRVAELEAAPSADPLEITDLKKRKLALKETITSFEESVH